MPSSKSDLTVNDAIDVLTTNANWIGAELFLSPPDDVNCSDEYVDDPQFVKLLQKAITCSMSAKNHTE